MRVKKRVFQAEGTACAKALRQEGAWYSLGMEMAGGTHGAWQETKLAVGGRQGLTKIKGSWDFSGSPVVKNPRFHCRGRWFHLWSGTKISHYLDPFYLTLETLFLFCKYTVDMWSEK